MEVRRLLTLSRNILLGITVVWATVAAAFVFAVRYDLLPDPDVDTVPVIGERLLDLPLGLVTDGLDEPYFPRPSEPSCLLFFDPSDPFSLAIINHFAGNLALPSDLRGQTPALILTADTCRIGVFAAGDSILRRVRSLPTLWVLQGNVIQSVVEASDGLHRMIAAAEDCRRPVSRWVSPILPKDAWHTVLPPERILNLALADPRIAEFIGESSPAGFTPIRRVTLHWNDTDSTAVWRVDLAVPDCDCPVSEVKHWRYAMAVMHPMTGQRIDLLRIGHLDNDALRAHWPL